MLRTYSRWLILITVLAGCSEQIPQGHVGKVLTSSGWNEGIHEAGYATCWGRDELYLLETGDASHSESLNILCADSLNFRCDLVIVSRAKGDSASRDAIFGRVKAEAQKNGRSTITSNQLYETYVKPIVMPSAYDVVSKRSTDQIGAQMIEIKREVIQLCKERMSDDMPIELLVIDFTNTDFPETVTLANEARKKKEIDVEIARSEADIEEARAEGKLRAANKEYQAQLLEAKMVADANRIIGESLSENPLFLFWHQIKVYGDAAKGPNNVFIVPYDAMGSGQGGMLNSALMRGALERTSSSGSQEGYEGAMERLKAAQQAADQAEQRSDRDKAESNRAADAPRGPTTE